jgi:hypothetical protein
MPLTPASAERMSGTYVGKGWNAAFLVQVVESADGHLTGRYEQMVLRPNGKLDDMSATITGAADGQTVVVTIKPGEILSNTIAASGTMQGGVLHLSGSGGLNFNLAKADEADFRAQVAILTERGNQIIGAKFRQEAAERQPKIEADRLAEIQNLTARMAKFVTVADDQLPKFPPVEQRYRDITRRMRAALAREQSIYGGGQAGVARSQISVGITQASIATDQLHMSMQSTYQNFDTNSGQLISESVSVTQGLPWGAHSR